MGGSAKPPQTSAADRKLQEQQIATQQAQIDIAKAQADAAGRVPVVKPLPAPPPPTQGGTDAAMAAEDAMRKVQKRTNSARGTLFAGETGGYQPGGKTLLG